MILGNNTLFYNHLFTCLHCLRKPGNSPTNYIRPNGFGAIGRSQSQWDMYDASSSTPSPRSNQSASSLDLARPFTSASATIQAKIIYEEDEKV